MTNSGDLQLALLTIAAAIHRQDPQPKLDPRIRYFEYDRASHTVNIDGLLEAAGKIIARLADDLARERGTTAGEIIDDLRMDAALEKLIESEGDGESPRP